MKIVTLCFVIVILVVPADAAAEDASPGDGVWEADHEQGLDRYQRGDFEAAAASFERADQRGAPAPNLYNLARSYQQSGRFRRAVEVFDRYLAAPGIPEERRETARTHRGEAMAQLARVEVRTVPSGATVVVGGHADVGGPSPLVITLDPGSYTLEASIAAHQTANTGVSLAAGTHRVVTLTLAPLQTAVSGTEAPPAPTTTEPTPTTPGSGRRWTGGPWVVFGIGAGIAVTGFALWAGAYAGSQQEERFETVEDYDHWQYWVYDLAFAGDILVGVGAAAAVAGLIWLTIDRLRSRRRGAASTHTLIGGVSRFADGCLATLRFAY